MRQLPLSFGLEANQSHAANYSVLIDTDIGDDIDDAFALALAACSPEIGLLGVTTVSGDTSRRAQLALHLLHTCGCDDIPVAAGIDHPMLYSHPPGGVFQANVLDDQGAHYILSELSGPELIIQTALAHPRRLILICLGQLTNVATALKLEPRLFMAIREIVMMGGSSSIPFPEWNIRSDAQAAQIVLASGIPITLIGWNITTRCPLREQDIEQLRQHDSPHAHLLYQLFTIWQQHRPRWHPALPYIHDALAVAALCKLDLFAFADMAVRVPLRGPMKGYMIPRLLNGPLVQAAVDIHAFEARAWVMQRLLAESSLQAS